MHFFYSKQTTLSFTFKYWSCQKVPLASNYSLHPKDFPKRHQTDEFVFCQLAIQIKSDQINGYINSAPVTSWTKHLFRQIQDTGRNALYEQLKFRFSLPFFSVEWHLLLNTKGQKTSQWKVQWFTEHTDSDAFWMNTNTCTPQSNMKPKQYVEIQKAIELHSHLTGLKCYLSITYWTYLKILLLNMNF